MRVSIFSCNEVADCRVVAWWPIFIDGSGLSGYRHRISNAWGACIVDINRADVRPIFSQGIGCEIDDKVRMHSTRETWRSESSTIKGAQDVK